MADDLEPEGVGALEPEILEFLETALKGADSFGDIGRQLHPQVPDEPEAIERHRAMVFAFSFMLISPTDEDRRRREESAFGAAWEMDGSRMPPKLHDVSEQDVAKWESASHIVAAPALRARLHDLLWERRHGDRYQHAKAAVGAYVEVASDSSWIYMDRVRALERAAELALLLRSEEDQAHVTKAIGQLFDADLEDQDQGGPGIALRLLQTLLRMPKERWPEELREMIDRASERYGADPHISDALIELRTQLVDAEQREALRREQVERWIERANQAEGILTLIWLREAHELATRHGLPDLADRARVLMQEVSPDELDLKTISTEVSLPTEEVEAFLAAVVSDDGWRDALTRLGVEGPPGGQPEEVEKEVRQQMERFPLQHLVNAEVAGGPYGATIFRATTPEQHLNLGVAQQRQVAGQLWAVFAGQAIERIFDAYGRPSRGELAEFFTTSLIAPETADRLARGLELYLDDEFDEAAHMLAPRIEAVIRACARAVQIPVVTLPRGDEPGGVRSLGGILHDLRPVWENQGWWAYLNNLLSDPLGLNLRNRISHALDPAFDRADAALLLHAACYLRGIRGRTRLEA